MRLLENLGTMAGRFTRAFLREARLKETILPDDPEMGEPEDHYTFRSLTRQTQRDLSPIKQQRQQELAYYLYLSNPIAFRAVEIGVDFVIGDGLGYDADDGQVKGILHEFWTDPVMAWEQRQWDRARSLSLNGELFFSANVRNGRARLGFIDPLDVAKVVMDPENGEIPYEVVLKGTTRKTLEKKKLRVVHVDETPGSKTFGRLVGEVFVFQVNKVSNASRGNSDLLSVIDWLDLHDQFLFGVAEAGQLKISHVWDVTMTGASQEQLAEAEARYGPIEAGSTRYHNEKISIQNVAPNLGTAELDGHARLLKVQAASGLGLPEHWLAEGGNANRATASEMGVPTTKRLRARQIFFRNMVAYMFRFAIDQAQIAGRIDRDADTGFRVTTPQIWAIDTQSITQSLLSASQGLSVAVDHGWITEDEAKSYWLAIANQLGVHLVTRGGEEGGLQAWAELDEAHQRRIREAGERIRGKQETVQPEGGRATA